jgi:HEAT repeats
MHTVFKRSLTVVVLLLLTVASRAQVAPAAPAGLADVLTRLEQRSSPSLALNAELEQLLRDEPALVASVPGLLRQGSLKSATTDVLIHVLEVIGSADAQRALGEILADPAQDHLDRLRAVVALGAVAAPTGDSLDTLWQATGARTDPKAIDVANTALLALGVAGSTLRQQSPAQYPALREELLSRMHGTGDQLERTLVLKAVGNLQDDSVGSQVMPFLADASAPVRASAAQSLGLMRCEASAPVLAGQLGTEPSGAVRIAIVTSLTRLQGTADAIVAVHDQLLIDPNPAARAVMVTYLGEHLDQLPAARPTLELLMLSDPARQVRLLAAKALYS